MGLGSSQNGFQQISFVNSIATTKGGTHVEYISKQIVDKVIEACKKKVGTYQFSITQFAIFTATN